MSCPVKYRAIGDFHAYYSGTTKAPYLTIFVGGNHEASSHLWELYYGGWAAPNIYYMGAASVVRLGGIRIAGMSGIWKGYNYRKPHYERLPYNESDVKSIYHVRELDIRKLLQLKTQVDIGISHDWPTAIEKHGNQRALFRMKPDFEQESIDGTLGNQAAAYVMDRLRPPYWFAAHLHCKFSAAKTYTDQVAIPPPTKAPSVPSDIPASSPVNPLSLPAVNLHNDDEIDLDMDDEEPAIPPPAGTVGKPEPNPDEVKLEDDDEVAPPQPPPPPPSSSVPEDLRAQLPAAFSRPVRDSHPHSDSTIPPPGITNKTVRFLALDKCLPGRKFLQLLEVHSHQALDVSPRPNPPTASTRSKPKFEYDPEWLAITRVFASDLILGDRSARPPPHLGESHYQSQIEAEEDWVDSNVVKKGRLEIPDNFEITAPIFKVGMPEIVSEGPKEYDNPQMQQFCDLVGIENRFRASEEERAERMRVGPAVEADRRFGGRDTRGGRDGRGGGRGRGERGGRGGGGRGRGRGRGGW